MNEKLKVLALQPFEAEAEELSGTAAVKRGHSESDQALIKCKPHLFSFNSDMLQIYGQCWGIKYIAVFDAWSDEHRYRLLFTSLCL